MTGLKDLRLDRDIKSVDWEVSPVLASDVFKPPFNNNVSAAYGDLRSIDSFSKRFMKIAIL